MNNIFELSKINAMDVVSFDKELSSLISEGYLVSAYFVVKYKRDRVRICFLARGSDLKLIAGEVREKLNSLTPMHFQLFCFEREIYEDEGIIFEGHPLLNPLRYKKTNQKEAKFIKVEGDEIHEVGVGPVHAGIIEPGHFRFQCHGEKVFNLQIELGYQHRGVEENLIGGPNKKTYHYIQTAAGDSTAAHTISYAKMMEALLDLKVSEESEILRVMVLELERMANHCGDLGALANDVAYQPTASFCGRIRGDILNTTALICGNRFGRNLISIGGCNFDIDKNIKEEIEVRLKNIYSDFINASELLWNDNWVVDRFKNTGIVDKKITAEIGGVGPAARAAGVNNDSREFFDFKVYKKLGFKADLLKTGDVYSRAYIRYLEFKKSYGIITSLLGEFEKIKKESYEKEMMVPRDILAFGISEGWRGLVFHTAVTDDQGRFIKYKIVDPSFHNWQMLAYALKNEEISNFPLCNKSFNLSYCGFDL
ncbi:MAG TPA: NADH-quinone oxidoreductase subunit C [Elusimicrobiales bacterium]|nr:NADH-quinone oxidoreductase subunit C [Elusimicrobiales bacterium]HOL63477.1 NADH-quinone oxidoreductase subunit C [Elusimicrobiales bacterium]HPO95601.1 NADH-quinone oxidoreductase subunit C [Elusimicrobiales bacterium]